MKLHKNIKLLAWFNFFTDFKLYAPVAIIYFARVSGSYTLGMGVFGLAQLASAMFEVPTGILSDRIGRRKTIVYGAIGSILSVIFYALGTYQALLVGAVLEGLARAFYSGNNDALLYDTLAQTKQENEYHKYLGKTSSMFQVALAASAVLGSIIAHFSFPLVFWLSTIPQILALATSLKMVEPRTHLDKSGNVFSHTKEAIKYFLKNRRLRLLSLASILRESLAEAGFQFRAAFIQTLWPIWAIGVTRIISNLGAAVSFYFSGKLIKKYTELKLLIAGNIYARIVNIFSLAFPTVLSPAFMASTSLFYGATQTAKNSLFQREFTKKQRATMSSLNTLAGSLAFAGVAPMLGLVADIIGPAKALLLTHFLLFSVVLIYWQLFKKEA